MKMSNVSSGRFTKGKLFKGQMQRNLDNLSFVENPFQKHQSYQQEAESTLKIWFCTNRGAQDKKIRRFPRALPKRTRIGRAEIVLVLIITFFLQ